MEGEKRNRSLQVSYYLLFYLSICFFCSYTQVFLSLDRALFDFYQSSINNDKPDADIVIVAIDDSSLARLGRWPWERSIHGKFLEQLHEADAVVFDVIFSEPTASGDADEIFVNAVKQHGKVILPVYLGQASYSGQVYEELPFSDLGSEAKGLGHVHVEYDDDGIVRSVFLKQGVGKAFWSHIAVSALKSTSNTQQLLPGKRTSESQSAFSIVKDYQNYIHFFNAGSFSTVSYFDVLDGVIPSDFFKNKVVFVGATATGLGDRKSTPVAEIAKQMPGVEVNANIFYSLKYDKFYSVLPEPITVFIVVMSAFILVLLASFLSNYILLLVSVLIALFVVSLEFFIAHVFQIWVHLATLAIATLFIYPLWAWLRFEKVVRFFRHEISELKKGQALTPMVTGKEKLFKSFNFLTQTGYVRGWEVVDSSYVTCSSSEVIFEVADTEEHIYVTTDFIDTPELAAIKAELEKILTEKYQVEKESPSFIHHDEIERYIYTIEHLQQVVDEFQELVTQSISLLKDGVVIADVCGHVVFANKVFQEWVGDIENMSEMFDVLDEGEDFWCDAYQNFMLQENTKSFELLDKRHEENRYFLMQGGLVDSRYYGGHLTLVSLTDITLIKNEQKKREEMMYYISHDLRSPISSIITLTENQLSQDPDNEFAKNVMQYAERNLKYANSFLDLSRAEFVDETAMQAVNLVSVVEQAKDNLILNANKKGVDIRLLTDKDEAWVLGNADLLYRAIQNLLDNALKFSESGGVVTIFVEPIETGFQCIVEDQGPGIPEGQLERIFNQFEKIGSNKQGAGLGLRIVKLVAEQHGGRVLVSNLPIQGARFIIELPAL